MKKAFFLLILLLVGNVVFGQQLPLNKIAPHRASFFQELTGRAIVNNENLTYWLYLCSPGDLEEIVGYLHSYVESIGYTIDYDSHSGIYENPQLVTSVRSLMSIRKRNFSVTIWNGVLMINIDTENVDSFKSLRDRKYYSMSWDLVRG